MNITIWNPASTTTIATFDASGYEEVTFKINGGQDDVDVEIGGGPSWEDAIDYETGNPIVLSQTAPQITLKGGLYRFTMTSPSGSTGLDAILGTAKNS